ncbi:MAG TPA: response regulator transcription factor [Vicinamibacterales bacterium]|jgi:DNA-binding response OmpR family regulator
MALQLLIVEDERTIRDLLRSHFEMEGYKCVSAPDGHDALKIANRQAFDVILLDVMLPGMDGLAVCRAIRTHSPNRDVPILFLTARCEEPDKLAGFGQGADDYLTKPFSMKELSARVGALTRRVRRTPVDTLAAAPPLVVRALRLDPARRSVAVRGAAVPVTPHEFRLLYRLAASPGEVFTRERLLADIWQGEAYVTERSIDTLVRRLRLKIEPDPAVPTYILTVWGDGYKIADE